MEESSHNQLTNVLFLEECVFFSIFLLFWLQIVTESAIKKKSEMC